MFVLEQKGKVFWNIEKSINLLSHHTLTSDKDLKILAHPYLMYVIVRMLYICSVSIVYIIM